MRANSRKTSTNLASAGGVGKSILATAVALLLAYLRAFRGFDAPNLFTTKTHSANWLQINDSDTRALATIREPTMQLSWVLKENRIADDFWACCQDTFRPWRSDIPGF